MMSKFGGNSNAVQSIDITPSGQQFHNRYRLEAKIGSGGMGMVYRVTDRLTQGTVALKRVLLPGEELTFTSMDSGIDVRLAMAQEFKILASLRHPNIISVLDYGFDE